MRLYGVLELRSIGSLRLVALATALLGVMPGADVAEVLEGVVVARLDMVTVGGFVEAAAAVLLDDLTATA
jgi:hypothetical protein